MKNLSMLLFLILSLCSYKTQAAGIDFQYGDQVTYKDSFYGNCKGMVIVYDTENTPDVVKVNAECVPFRHPDIKASVAIYVRKEKLKLITKE